MRVEELMVGNYTDNNVEIIRISAMDIMFLSESDNMHFCNGVILTDEWITDFGFKIWKHKNEITFYKDHVFIHKRKRGYVMSKRFKELKYVHELQNFFFISKGKQLIKQ